MKYLKKAAARTNSEFNRAIYNSLARGYESEFLGSHKYKGHTTLFNTIARYADITRPGYKVLDVGVGTGLLSAEFRRVNPQAHLAGIDLSERMLAECAKKRILDTSRLVDIETNGLPFPDSGPDSGFDAVVSAGVFELLRYPGEVIREMARVTRPGGLVAFTSVANDRDEETSLLKTLKRIPEIFNRTERGTAHRRALLVEALGYSGVKLIHESTFPGYRKWGFDTPYKLYVGSKPANIG